MGRVEIFENRQPLFKIGDDRRLDNLARWLGHETTHAGQLLHLRWRATGTGMGHHIDRVERGVARVTASNASHHRVRHLVRALGPDVDDLVVLLALGDQAFGILTLKLLDHVSGMVHQGLLGLRNDHIILAERDAGATGA